ncbi:hypothetical protein KKB55_22690, partial [Myxococcota bacterium]|nr:hypothetical protein [Myxococcota bacterium]
KKFLIPFSDNQTRESKYDPDHEILRFLFLDELLMYSDEVTFKPYVKVLSNEYTYISDVSIYEFHKNQILNRRSELDLSRSIWEQDWSCPGKQHKHIGFPLD